MHVRTLDVCFVSVALTTRVGSLVFHCASTMFVRQSTAAAAAAFVGQRGKKKVSGVFEILLQRLKCE